jgi:monovalent cation/proton antiporter MnhG/PhaG subunit
MTAWLADALVVAGLAVMTLGVYGILRFPDVYTRLHAAGAVDESGHCPGATTAPPRRGDLGA